MEPTSNKSSGAETSPLRGKTKAATEQRGHDAPPAPPRSGVRVWPPRPSEAPATLPEMDLSTGLTETVEDDTLIVRKRMRGSAPAAQPVPAAEVAVRERPVCPRCHAKLIDPEGMGVCPGCGYCRSLEENRDKVGRPDSLASRPVWREALRAVLLPGWVWVTFGGAVAIVLVALVANKLLPEWSRQRTLWSTLQLACGAAMVVLAQWWAVVKLAWESENLGAFDLLMLSGRLWKRALSQMPATRGPVYLGFWGLVLILAAVFIIGGLSAYFGSPVHASMHGAR